MTSKRPGSGPRLPPILSDRFFRALRPGGPEALARALLGMSLRHDEVLLRITEVEAYGGPEDSASHARMGCTPRNAPMWGPAGHAYVYLIYGIHRLLNVTAGPAAAGGGAVLIRAAEVLSGHDQVTARRGGRTGPDALAGPGRVGQALAVSLAHSGSSLRRPGGLELRGGEPPTRVRVGPRVGIGYAGREDRDAPLRFADAESSSVTQSRTLRPESSCPTAPATSPRP